MLNKEQVGGLLRLAVGALSGFFIAKGFGDAALWADIAAGAAIVGAGIWSLFIHAPGTKIDTVAQAEAKK